MQIRPNYIYNLMPELLFNHKYACILHMNFKQQKSIIYRIYFIDYDIVCYWEYTFQKMVMNCVCIIILILIYVVLAMWESLHKFFFLCSLFQKSKRLTFKILKKINIFFNSSQIT